MPAHAQPPAAYAVIVEYEDGTVGTSLVVDQGGQVVLTPSREDLRLAAWLIAYSLADEDKELIHDLGGPADRNPDPSAGIGFLVADEADGEGHEVFVQPMGRVKTRV